MTFILSTIFVHRTSCSPATKYTEIKLNIITNRRVRGLVFAVFDQESKSFVFVNPP